MSITAISTATKASPLHASPAAVSPTALKKPLEATAFDRDVQRLTELEQTAKGSDKQTEEAALRKEFESTFGELLFTEMLKSMRKSVGNAAYFNGGRAEEMFTQQLDQVLAQKMSNASADTLLGPMYDLFALQRAA